MRLFLFLSLFTLSFFISSVAHATRYPFYQNDVSEVTLDIPDPHGTYVPPSSGGTNSGTQPTTPAPTTPVETAPSDDTGTTEGDTSTGSATPTDNETQAGGGTTSGGGSTTGGTGTTAAGEETPISPGAGDTSYLFPVDSSSGSDEEGDVEGGGSSGGGSTPDPIGDIVFTLTREDIEAIFSGGWTDSGNPITRIQDINSLADVRSYVSQLVRADEHIVSLSLEQRTIVTEYTLPARLFGFIPVRYVATVTVKLTKDNTLSSVDIGKSWWLVFATGDDTKVLKAQISTQVTELLRNQDVITADDVASFLQRIAQLFSLILEMLRGFFSGHAV